MSEQPRKWKLNWWMIAFLVTLFAFEVAREIAVTASNEEMAGDSLHIFGSPGYATAQGQWFRSDGGSPIVEGTVTIHCIQEKNICVEAQTTFIGSGVKWASTDVTIFEPYEFSDAAVSYVNENPTCAIYRVRIDLAQQRVTATRDQKPGVNDANCLGLEKRVAMELGDGPKNAIYNKTWMDDHFLPVINTIRAFNK